MTLLKPTKTVKGLKIGRRMVERLTYSLIHPKFLPEMSWTGRGKIGEKKIKFGKYIHIVSFLTDITLKSVRSWNYDLALHEVKYTVIKRGPSKFGDDKKKSSSKRSSSSKEIDGMAEKSVSPTLSIDSNTSSSISSPSSSTIHTHDTLNSHEPTFSNSNQHQISSQMQQIHPQQQLQKEHQPQIPPIIQPTQSQLPMHSQMHMPLHQMHFPMVN